jgi:NAD(P)H-hydrate epimerase
MYSNQADVRQVIKARPLDSSKRDFGSLLVVGGSDVYSGAPALAALAALRTGAGLTVIAAPASVAATMRGYSPNLIVHSLSSDVVNSEDMDKLSKLLTSANALLLGPGIGLRSETKETVTSIVGMAAHAGKPVLIDADAIRALANRMRELKGANAVLTPHSGEFKAVSGVEVPRNWRERLPICKKFALDYSCTLLLKGYNTIVSDGRRLKVNRTGNPGMAVGGMGDVLSGIIGAFLAQGADPFCAAVAGAYIHGLAGDLVRKSKGFHMVASDVIEVLPQVLRGYDRIVRA